MNSSKNKLNSKISQIFLNFFFLNNLEPNKKNQFIKKLAYFTIQLIKYIIITLIKIANQLNNKISWFFNLELQGHDLEPNELSTINLQRMGEKVRLFMNGITASKDLKYK